ncbi:hypothetical protein [Cellulosimicrobium cellulans]|uniref:hypothetical protein n=1 Tax=Cellulosimicrobium cellulans TaxID=1710 RepID=UPI0008492745|nr:hypothetical protein [Cellulosimicrobium cellulans]
MSHAPDPTGTVTITGGTVTAVDTETILAQAGALRSAADLVAEGRAACRTARQRVGGARWAGTGPLGGGTYGTSSLTGSFPDPASTAREHAAALEAVDALDAALADLEALLDDVVLRTAKASGTYAAAESAAAQVLGTVADVPVVGLLAAVLVGEAAFLGGLLAGDGFRWERIITGGGEMHERAIASTGALLGFLDPERDLFEAPTVANAAAVLRRLSESWRGLFRDGIRVERLGPERSPDPALMPPPRDAQDLLRRIDVVYGTEGEDNPVPHSTIALEKIVRDDGQATWVVTIPGTQLGRWGTPFSMTSNYDLMSAEEAQAAEAAAAADSAVLVLAALEDAGVSAEDEVVLVGHSQGGMVAAAVALATAGSAVAGSTAGGGGGPGSGGSGSGGAAAGSVPQYRVTHVVTAGAPVGGLPLPPSVLGTHVENRQEGVSSLDGRPNPGAANQVTVTRDHVVGGESDPGAVPHGVEFHVGTLADAEAIGHPGLGTHLEEIERSLDGRRVDTRYYRGTLELDPEAVADRVSDLGPPGLPGVPDVDDLVGTAARPGGSTVVAPGPDGGTAEPVR